MSNNDIHKEIAIIQMKFTTHIFAVSMIMATSIIVFIGELTPIQFNGIIGSMLLVLVVILSIYGFIDYRNQIRKLEG